MMDLKFLFFAVWWMASQLKYDGDAAEVRTSLAELPLEKLLNVKQALVKDATRVLAGNTDVDDDGVTVEVAADDGASDPGAMPLKSDLSDGSQNRQKNSQFPIRRGEDWEKGDSKGGISKIFQTTVTVLAFLAFGGYLMCMIVMAIRNNTAATMAVTTTTVAPATAYIGRRKRGLFLTDDSPYVESLTYSLHRIAEGYVKYHDVHPN